MEYIFLIAILLFSIVIHEVAHGAVANHIGDPTAKLAGRLTLNPIKHLDPFGSVLLPFILIVTTGFGFGYAKPVPVNPFNFNDQKWGNLKVSIAGPMSNFVVALIFGLLLKFFSEPLFSIGVYQIFFFIVQINILLGVFNLLPIPPLDGSHILFSVLPRSMDSIRLFLSQFGFMILIFVLVFFFDWIFNLVSWISKILVRPVGL